MNFYFIVLNNGKSDSTSTSQTHLSTKTSPNSHNNGINETEDSKHEHSLF
jgi:hypothetical protein